MDENSFLNNLYELTVYYILNGYPTRGPNIIKNFNREDIAMRPGKTIMQVYDTVSQKILAEMIYVMGKQYGDKYDTIIIIVNFPTDVEGLYMSEKSVDHLINTSAKSNYDKKLREMYNTFIKSNIEMDISSYQGMNILLKFLPFN